MPKLQWLRIVDRAADIVTSYDEVGGCNLQQAYYRLVSQGLIPHTRRRTGGRDRIAGDEDL